MEIKITLFTTLLLYAVVVSQSLFYLLAMSQAARNMQPATYIESRQLLDKRLQVTLSTVYYLALASAVLLVAFCVIRPSGLLFISSVIALLCLVIDVVLAKKGNVPLNTIINTWSTAEYPRNWKEYRHRWLSIYAIRQVANITGFVALVTGLIFGM